MTTNPESGLVLCSTVKSDNTLELSLVPFQLGELAPGEVLIRVEAAPINPSDLGLLFGPADMTTARRGGTDERPVITADIPAGSMSMVAARVDRPLPVGNEGSGVVVKAGSAPHAQALLGKVVAMVGGAMYAHYRKASVEHCLVLPDGTTPREAASCFVNPLTALGMVETMKAEGHSALVHTAAASNLGQMLNKLCLADGVPLVNIVRKPEQEALLRGLGAKYVVSSSARVVSAGPDGGGRGDRRHPGVRRDRRRRAGRADPRRAWRPRRAARPPSTAATAARCTSSSTSTAGSIAARPCCGVTSGLHGASAAGC